MYCVLSTVWTRYESVKEGSTKGDPEGLLGKVMGEVRRSMSVTVVRAQAVCLLERLAHLLPGARDIVVTTGIKPRS